MRRLGLALALLAGIPAMAIPLLACVAVLSTPAALIAGIAAISGPSESGRGDLGRRTDIPEQEESSRNIIVRHEASLPRSFRDGEIGRSRIQLPDDHVTGM